MQGRGDGEKFTARRAPLFSNAGLNRTASETGSPRPNGSTRSAPFTSALCTTRASISISISWRLSRPSRLITFTQSSSCLDRWCRQRSRCGPQREIQRQGRSMTSRSILVDQDQPKSAIGLTFLISERRRRRSRLRWVCSAPSV